MTMMEEMTGELQALRLFFFRVAEMSDERIVLGLHTQPHAEYQLIREITMILSVINTELYDYLYHHDTNAFEIRTKQC